MQPIFRIYANSQEITAAIRDRLIELVVTDEAGIQSDELKLTLDDRRREDGSIAELPRIGTVLTVSIGYAETRLVSLGRFIVDELEIRSPPATLTVSAKAADMVAKGLCSILASDYYYPAPLLAAFRLVHDDVLTLPEAWALVSSNPAAAVGMKDRGAIAAGQRADLLLVDDQVPTRPRIVAVIAGGRLVHLVGAERLHHAAAPSRLSAA